MNNPLILSKTLIRSCGDATYIYDIRIKQNTTLSEFVNSVLLDTTEWGCITVRKGGCLIMDIWYRYGAIESKSTFGPSSVTFDDIGSRNIYGECEANGGWTRMDYTVTLEEE